MKRVIFVFLLVVGFVLFLGISLIYIFIWNTNADGVTGEVVTGEITSANLAITIAIIGGPSLTILNPENKTYLKNESLLLNFIAGGEETVWYNFDNTANTTITSSILFNISQGSHTLYMFANNTDGNETARNVTFVANSTKFIILYNEYADSNKGESTDFNASTYEDIQNLGNIILEDTKYGKIQFNEAINITNDLANNDNLLDLDINTNISENRIELNSTALPNFNKSATLYLYNLNFSNPRVLRDGVICPSSVCTSQSYSGGNLTFDVTEFTVYSAEETPAAAGEAAPAPSPAGGGPGGLGLSFTTNIDEIIISLKQGEIKAKEIKIKNQRDTKLSFSLSTDIGELVKIRPDSFELEPKEEKTIFIDFIAKENTVPELYLGNLLIRMKGEQKNIPITIEVESKEILFDVRLNILENYLEIFPGEELISEIEIFNIIETGKVDITIEYSIKDQQNREIISEEEIISVEGFINFTKKFEIPKNIESGRYILYVRVTYDGKVASASEWFEVKGRFVLKPTQIYIITGILILLILIIFIILIKRRKDKSVRKIQYNRLTGKFKGKL